MGIIKRVAKNTFVLFIAQIINILLSIILVSLLARFLLPAGYGKYSFALSFTAIFAILMDMGLNTLLIREISRKKEALGRYLNNIITMRIVLAVIVFILMILAINLMHYPSDTTIAVYIIGLYVIISSFSDIFASVFRAFEKMEFEAIANVMERITTVGLAVIALFSGYGLTAIALILLFASVVRLLISFLIYSRKFSVSALKIETDVKLWKNILKISIPFALAGIFTMLYLKIDTIMLSMMKGDAAVGWYNAAYGIVLSLSFIPGVFLAAIFPVLSNYFITMKKMLKKAYALSFKYLLTIALPMAAGIYLLAEKIILLFFGNDYLPSVGILKILVLIQIFAFLAWLSGVILNSINRQKLFMYSTGVGVVINIMLNLFLIPKFSLYGAAIATLITQIVVFALLFHFGSKYCCKIKLTKVIISPLISVIVMSLAVLTLGKLSLAAIIPIGAAIYFAFLYLLGGISKEDKEILFSIIKPKK